MNEEIWCLLAGFILLMALLLLKAYLRPKGYIWIRDLNKRVLVWPDPLHKITYVDLFWAKMEEWNIFQQEIEIDGRKLKIDLRPKWQNGKRYYRVVMRISLSERDLCVDPRQKGEQKFTIEYMGSSYEFVYSRQRPR